MCLSKSFNWGGQIPGIFISQFSTKLALFVLHLCISLRWIAKPFKLIPFQLPIIELQLTLFRNAAFSEYECGTPSSALALVLSLPVRNVYPVCTEK